MPGIIYIARVPENAEPIVQATLDDVRKLSQAERRPLAKWPMVDMYVGNELVFRAPKRALLAFSSGMQEIFDKHPKTPGLSFQSQQVPKYALYDICDFIKGNCFTTFSLKPRGDFVETVNLLRVACLFGMHKYTRNLTMYLNSQLEKSHTVPTYQELEAIVQLEPNNPIFTYAAVIMSSYRYKNPEDTDFESWLIKYPIFKNAMDAYSKKKEGEKEQIRAQELVSNFPGLPEANPLRAEDSLTPPRIKSFNPIGLPVKVNGEQGEEKEGEVTENSAEQA